MHVLVEQSHHRPRLAEQTAGTRFVGVEVNRHVGVSPGPVDLAVGDVQRDPDRGRQRVPGRHLEHRPPVAGIAVGQPVDVDRRPGIEPGDRLAQVADPLESGIGGRRRGRQERQRLGAGPPPHQLELLRRRRRLELGKAPLVRRVESRAQGKLLVGMPAVDLRNEPERTIDQLRPRRGLRVGRAEQVLDLRVGRGRLARDLQVGRPVGVQRHLDHDGPPPGLVAEARFHRLDQWLRPAHQGIGLDHELEDVQLGEDVD